MEYLTEWYLYFCFKAKNHFDIDILQGDGTLMNYLYYQVFYDDPVLTNERRFQHSTHNIYCVPAEGINILGIRTNKKGEGKNNYHV